MDRGRIVEIDESGRPLRISGIRTDVTDRIRAMQALERQKRDLELAASVYETTQEGILITDSDGTILRSNKSVSRITGFSSDEMVGRNPKMFSSGRQDAAFYKTLWQTLLADDHWEGEVWNRHKSGHVYAELLRITAVRNEHGTIVNFVSTFSDITREKEHKEELERIAYYDALTGLPNRVLLTDRLRQAIVASRRSSQIFACLFIDLDGFKEVNDTHGHDIGDSLLIEVAKRMRSALREMDTLSRIGGDEFVAIMGELPNVSSSEITLVRLLNAVCQPVLIGAITAQVSASIGVTFFPQSDEVDADQILRQADHAMYQSKLKGKNCFTVFDHNNDREIRDHHETVTRISLALYKGEFKLFYQPKADTFTGLVIGAEALIRWEHPERGIVPPLEFLPEIVGQPMETEIGDWVIATALDQMAEWSSRAIHVPVSVNINLSHLEQSDFVERLELALSERPSVRPEDLTLEILETSNFKDEQRVLLAMKRCSALGVSFALDDFGTGYSSLAHLRRLPVRQLKLDQSFVREILDNDDDGPIVAGIIALANVFGIEVIAEGVETEQVARTLAAMGCSRIQGYYLSRPVPAAQFEAWLRVRRG
jgi:diguanylate cyclase (GGDEF)-like protein/PAS domain S-box-containing protein